MGDYPIFYRIIISNRSPTLEASLGNGPLNGVTVLEFASIGPGPFCAMLLSDMGANVIRIDRRMSDKVKAESEAAQKFDFTFRGRRSIALDLKRPEAVEICLRLIEKADIIQEGFRPGVMERLGLGPDVCFQRNPKIVYGRMTGWGQHGPLSQAAGHDLNYASITGAIHAIGPGDRKPTPPLNLVGDYGGGALYLAMGMLAALVNARSSGVGQVVDAAMSDGAASLMTLFYSMLQAGNWNENRRQSNILDGGAAIYNTYETSDGKYISIASLEPQFYALLRSVLKLDEDIWNHPMDKSMWAAQKAALDNAFKTKTRAEWCSLMEGTDICFAPVLTMSEAPHHPHNKARETFVVIDGAFQPNIAPRFSHTVSSVQGGISSIGAHTDEVLLAYGFSESELRNYKAAGVL